MLEQDVQLTRLIVEKLTELDQRKQQVGWQLAEAQERLDKVESLRQERSNYESVLDRAAALLGRDDLRVEVDLPADDAQLAEDLQGQMNVLLAEQGQYLELVDELRKRAPELLSAAAGMAPDSLQSLFRAELDAEADAGPAASEMHDNDSDEPDISAESEQQGPVDEASDLEAVEMETASAETAMADAEPAEDDAELEAAATAWTPPAFRPGSQNGSHAADAGTDEAEVVAQLGHETAAQASLDAGEPAADENTESLQAPASNVQWPELGEELPVVSIAASAWDDDEIEVSSSINYEELAAQTEIEEEPLGELAEAAVPYSNGHHPASDYSNGTHLEDSLENESAEQPQAEPDFAPSYLNGAADFEHEAVLSEAGDYSSMEDDADSLESEEEQFTLANGAAGFVVESEDSQAFAEVHAPALEHDTDFRTPSFEEAAGLQAEHFASAVAVETMDEEESVVVSEQVEDAEREEETRERLLRLARFNHAQLSKRIEGPAPVFVIDATAVLERIPHYDRYHLALDESAARDELVRDFSFLAGDLKTDVHLVFNDPHTPAFELNAGVMLEHGDSSSGDPNPGDQRIQEIVLDNVERERQVALVTSDPMLMSLFKGENVLVFSLGEFFLT